ncbi:MAG: HD domain-containing protein [Alphaproteobacteria bacterium]|nr:MAG: HD domain-containing protein [Alphaproteobacteria bacterium]
MLSVRLDTILAEINAAWPSWQFRSLSRNRRWVETSSMEEPTRLAWRLRNQPLVMKTQLVLSSLQTAADMAARAHGGQSIRDTDIPYISHPVRVAMLVSNVFRCGDSEVAAAALLHDTLEKTTLTPDEILENLGARVLHLVRAMTKDPGGSSKEYWKTLAAEVWEARLIKMADALDHLDCPPEDLKRRLRSAKKAAELAYSNEAPLLTARRVLDEAMEAAVFRQGTHS